MDPNQVRIEELYTLTKENNELLKKIRHGQLIAQWTRVFYWVVIIVMTLGGVYFLKPYLNNLLNVYGGGASNISNISQFSDIKHAQQILDQIKSLQQ